MDDNLLYWIFPIMKRVPISILMVAVTSEAHVDNNGIRAEGVDKLATYVWLYLLS